MVDRATGEVIGEAVRTPWQPEDESRSFRIVLVPGRYGRGLGTEATRPLVGHGFERLGRHRVSLEVYAFGAPKRWP